jgi:hypothetical protein
MIKEQLKQSDRSVKHPYPFYMNKPIRKRLSTKDRQQTMDSAVQFILGGLETFKNNLPSLHFP